MISYEHKAHSDKRISKLNSITNPSRFSDYDWQTFLFLYLMLNSKIVTISKAEKLHKHLPYCLDVIFFFLKERKSLHLWWAKKKRKKLARGGQVARENTSDGKELMRRQWGRSGEREEDQRQVEPDGQWSTEWRGHNIYQLLSALFEFTFTSHTHNFDILINTTSFVTDPVLELTL